MKKKDITVIIINYNTPKLTVDCVRSVLKDVGKLKVEVIVVDNGSEKDSIKVLEQICSAFDEVTLTKNIENKGFSVANNQGINISKGKYILLLNSDTIVKKGALSELFDFAEKTPVAGVVGARLLNPNGSLQPSCMHFPTILRAIKEYWLGEKSSFEKFVPKGKNPVEVEAVVGAAFLITPKALKKAGMLNEKYFMYFEDLDYCRKVGKKGLKVYYLPEAEVVHYHGASGRNVADSANQWRRLIPSSKIYHGLINYYLLNFVLWSGQKWKKYISH